VRGKLWQRGKAFRWRRYWLIQAWKVEGRPDYPRRRQWRVYCYPWRTDLNLPCVADSWRTDLNLPCVRARATESRAMLWERIRESSCRSCLMRHSQSTFRHYLRSSITFPRIAAQGSLRVFSPIIFFFLNFFFHKHPGPLSLMDRRSTYPRS